MYTHAQLARALRTWTTHDDPEVRHAAERRIRQWTKVIEGVADGSLNIGSRTPVADVPAWATLEVVHGGFATGGLLAEHEHATRTNEDALGPGRDRWLDRLKTGAYRIEVPEHGAIPVALRLLERGHTEAALDLLETLTPWMGRLQFVPLEADPRPETGTAFVRSVGEVAKTLAARQPQPRVTAMNLTLGTWRPLQDELAALLAETSDEGRVGAHIPEGWWSRARAVLARAELRVASHPSARRPRDRRTALGGLLHALREAVTADDAGPLARATGALGDHVRSRGEPGGPANVARSEAERAHAARPVHATVAQVAAERLALLNPDAGLPDPAPLLGALTADEARAGAPEGTPLSPGTQARIRASQQAPLDVLVEEGQIASAEVLAAVAPQITAAVRASSLDDPVLRMLIGRIDEAFRRRRGLLLLDLQQQVRLDELPWVAAVAPLRTKVDGADAARITLSQVTRLAFTGFPQTQLPNPVVSELRDLAESAGVQVPLTEEIAADIFMGTFTPKFVHAARITAHVLHGTLYARYFDLPETLPAVDASQRGQASYVELCRTRLPASGPKTTSSAHLEKMLGVVRTWRTRHSAFLDALSPHEDTAVGGLPLPTDAPVTVGEASLGPDEVRDLRRVFFRFDQSTAHNGALIEQSLVLTSHNVVPLIQALDVRPLLEPAIPEMCDRTFAWIQQRVVSLDSLEGIQRLRATKNAAYAWRQLILWLSLDPAGPEPFLERTHLGEAGRVLHPVWKGLVRVARGERFVGETVGDGRRLYGWSPGGPHWLTR